MVDVDILRGTARSAIKRPWRQWRDRGRWAVELVDAQHNIHTRLDGMVFGSPRAASDFIRQCEDTPVAGTYYRIIDLKEPKR